MIVLNIDTLMISDLLKISPIASIIQSKMMKLTMKSNNLIYICDWLRLKKYIYWNLAFDMTVHQMQIFLATKKKKKQLNGPVQSKVDFVCLWVSRGNDSLFQLQKVLLYCCYLFLWGCLFLKKKQSMLIAIVVFLDVW